MKALTILFEAEGLLRLPLAKFDILQGAFYQLLRSGNSELASALHDAAGGRQFKRFCFTDVHGRGSVQEKTISFSGALSWEIRSMDDAVIDVICEALSRSGRFFIHKTPCSVLSLREQCSRTLLGPGAMLIAMDTPITVYETAKDGRRTFYSPTDERFCTAVENNLRRKYQAVYGMEPEFGIEFRGKPDTGYRKCVTYYSKAPVTAYYGTFLLTAPGDVCDIAYYCGIGAKNSQGFGTIRSLQRQPNYQYRSVRTE